MSLIRTGMKMMYGTSPWGLVAIGGLLTIALAPTAKKAARKAAVATTKGVLTVAGATNSVTNRMKSNMESIVEEAREQPDTDTLSNFRNKIMTRNKAMAVGATKGVLRVTDTVNDMREKVSSQVNDLVEEARNSDNSISDDMVDTEV